MKKIIFRTAIVALVIFAGAALAGGIFVYREFEKLESDDPAVWEPAINKLTENDHHRSYPSDAVLFVGSSSIRFWSTLEQDMDPIPVIQRGFGGAKLSDVLYYSNRIIWPYRPKSIVLFAGTNDITGRQNDKTPGELLVLFKTLVEDMERRLPGTTLYYLPITPTSSRWEIWPIANCANHLIEEYAEGKNQVVYINTTPHFLDNDGSIKKEVLFWDGIHLNKKGYAIWVKLLKPRLLESH